MSTFHIAATIVIAFLFVVSLLASFRMLVHTSYAHFFTSQNPEANQSSSSSPFPNDNGNNTLAGQLTTETNNTALNNADNLFVNTSAPTTPLVGANISAMQPTSLPSHTILTNNTIANHTSNSSSSSLPSLASLLNKTSSFSIDAVQKTITVDGNATAQVKPDIVSILLSVQNENRNVSMAIQNDSDTVQKVLHSLSLSGLGQNEIFLMPYQISLISANTLNNQSDIDSNTGNTTTSTNNKYMVTRTIKVTSPHLDDTSRWISASIDAGANRIDNVSFMLSDKKLLNATESLIQPAADNAWQKAKMSAAVLGLRFVGLKSFEISKVSVNPSPTISLPIANTDISKSALLPIPINDVSVSVNVKLSYLVRERLASS
jgi:uncharacterized protein